MNGLLCSLLDVSDCNVGDGVLLADDAADVGDGVLLADDAADVVALPTVVVTFSMLLGLEIMVRIGIVDPLVVVPANKLF